MKTNPDQPQDAAGLRRRAEARLQTRERNPQSMPDTQRLVHELQVHQTELEMQNEELRRAQHELEVSREKYFDLYDLAPVGYLTLNEPGLILEANLTAARLLGVARTDLLQQPLTRFILREDLDIFYQHRQQLFETRASQYCELRLTRPGGTPIWVRGVALLAQDHDAAAPVCRVTLSDLTERKQAEADRERLAQFERLAQLMKCASDIILLTGEHGLIIEANDRALETYGYSLAELRQKTLEDLRTPESRAEFPQHAEQLETDGRAVFEAMHQRRNGSVFPVEISARFLQIAGVRHRLGVVRDITERKRAEEALRESEQRLDRVVKNINDALIIDDVAGRVVYANEKFFQLFGIPERKLHSLTLEDYVAPEWRKELRDRHDRWVRGEPVPERFEYLGLRTDGSRLWLEVSVAEVSESGRIVGTQSVIRDITQRKRAEAFVRLERDLGMALAKAHELDETLRLCLEVAMRAAGMDCGGIYLKDRATGCLDMVVHAGLSAEFVENVSRCEADSPKTRLVEAGKPVYVNYARLTPPLSQAERREGLRAIAAVPIRHENRTTGCLNVASHTLKEVPAFARDAVEAIASQVGSAVARAQAEQALRASEERYRTLFEAMDEGFCVVEMLYDPDGKAVDYRFVEINPAFEKHTGLQQALGRTIREMVPNQDAHWFEIYGKVARTGEAIRFESPAKAMQRHYDVFAFRIGGDGSQRVGILFNDITERKQAERELRESEEKFAAAFHVSPSLMAFTRMADGVILEVNEGYSRLLGYSRGESVGKTTTELSIWVDPADRATFVARLKESGQITDFETRLRCKDGSVLTVVDSSRTMKLQDETCILSVIHDITERKQAEKRVQIFSQEIIAAREEERKRVSSVLHHDVGSLAVGIAAHLDAVEEDLRSGKAREALKWMKRTRKLFDESVVRLKKLAIELRPPELDVLGLRAALRQYFSQVTEHGGTRIHFRETLGRRRVPGDTATILFRVAQEALTNAITHGHATRVDVVLSASKKEVGLTVRNNGKGFNPSEHRARAASQMGLRVMQEMAASIGGTFTLDSGRGKRTTVRVRLPIADRGMRNAD